MPAGGSCYRLNDFGAVVGGGVDQDGDLVGLHRVVGIWGQDADQGGWVVDGAVEPEVFQVPGQDHGHAVVYRAEQVVRGGGDDGA